MTKVERMIGEEQSARDVAGQALVEARNLQVGEEERINATKA